MFSASTRADVRTDARVHFTSGMELIASGRLDAGIAELEVAYEILPHPHVLFNIARAYGEAGRYEEALQYFERYLEGEPADREEVRGFVRALQARLTERTPSMPLGAETPTTVTEDGDSMAVATEAEIVALEESATQSETLGEATDSDVLRSRAQSLRALAHQLRASAAAARVAPTGPASTASAAPIEPGPETGGATALALGDRQEAIYDETVVSASRFAQNPLDAPNAIANVTRQDIRLSGLLNPAELIRRTPGAHVMSTGVSDVQVGMRGFNQRFSPRVLTLINGRSIYVDTLG
ncbi:MAG: TonB-dependent receptor plug domain-containing protein, partial [Polyangiaceae bacterium]|nr:TonB-dependent receptor plug domain-containing protein [Polyangiaceae bacterium]